MKREEFDIIFEEFINELLDNTLSNEKQNFSSDDAIKYFKKSKERFYTTLNFLPSEIFKSKNCLEIGMGFFTAFMNAKGVQTIGTGKNLHFWELWAKQKKIKTYEVNFTKSLPFEDNTFETIFFCEVMEHLMGFPEDYLNELYRVLKPKGYLILTTPNLLRTSNRLRFLFGKNFLDPCEKTFDGIYHLREFEKKELGCYLKKAGFNIQTLKTFNYFRTFNERLVYGIFNFPNLRRMLFTLCKK